MSKEQRPYDHILIVGPQISGECSSAIISAWEAMGLRDRVVVFGDGEDQLIDDEQVLQTLQGRTHSGTRIHYFGHGRVIEDTKEHGITLHKEERPTASVLAAHKDIPGIRHVWSCFAGAAKGALSESVKQGMSVVLHSGEDYPTLSAMSAQSIISLTQFCEMRQQKNISTTVYDDCAYRLITSPETLIVMTPGKEPFRASAPHTALSIQDITPYTHHQLTALHKHFGLSSKPLVINAEQQKDYYYYAVLLRINHGMPIDNQTLSDDNVNRVVCSITSPMLVACEAQNMPALRMLLVRGVSIGMRYPLVTICQHGNLDLLYTILDRLFCVDIADIPRVMTALTEAVEVAQQHFNPHIVEIIKDKVREVLVAACGKGDHALQQAIFAGGVLEGNALFYWACEKGENALVGVLLQQQGMVTIDYCHTNEETPLMAACRGGHLDVVRLLLQKGANPHLYHPDTQKTALHLTVYLEPKSALAIIDLLVTAGASIHAMDSWGRMPLHYACESDEEAMVLQLLNYPGGDVMPRDNNGDTPLHLAVDSGTAVMVTALLAKGHKQSVEYRDEDGYTPLHRAVRAKNAEVIAPLIEHGADVNSKHLTTECTALHFAAKRGEVDIMRPLLNHGADIDAQDSKKRTPLWVAVYKGQGEAVELLLDRGANAALPDGKNRTPLSIATQEENDDMIDILYTNSAVVRLESQQCVKSSKDTDHTPFL